MIDVTVGRLALIDFLKKHRSEAGRSKKTLLDRVMTANRTNAYLAMIKAEIAGGLTRREAVRVVAKRSGEKVSMLTRLRPVRRVKI